jgi:hypothetical protein
MVRWFARAAVYVHPSLPTTLYSWLAGTDDIPASIETFVT